MINIECLYNSCLDSCCLKIICGCQIEHFLSWTVNEFVHPLLPHFLASSKVLKSLGLKKSWRPSKCISVLMREPLSPHPSSCTCSAWKVLRKRVFFSFSVDWHLDINQRICSATWLGFFVVVKNKAKQKYVSPFFWRTQENASWTLKSGNQLCLTAHSLGYGEWNPDVPMPDFWDCQSLGSSFLLLEIGK